MKVRTAAYETLKKIYLEDAYANLALRQWKNHFSSAEQAFVTALVYGSMQNDLYTEYLWHPYTQKEPKKEIGILLNMAAYELCFMSSPTYAVINEAVDLAKKEDKNSAKFVNFVLRRVAEKEKTEVSEEDEDRRLSLTYSMPLWIVKMWKKQYGYETTEKILASFHTEHKQYLRVNTLKTSKEELLKKDERFREEKGDAVSFAGNYIRTSYFKEGVIFPQDYHSQLVVEMAELNPQDRILDVCAAPGSKTFQMAAVLKNEGEILAVDIYPSRVKLIESGAQKAGADCIQTLTADGRDISAILEENSFDVVFLDAPCSGLGTLRHKNDIKLRIQPEGLDEIQQLQKELLEEAAKMVKTGGKLIYSTCTLNKKENEKQIGAFLERHKEYEAEEMRTCFPFEDDADGFFMAKCRRIA